MRESWPNWSRSLLRFLALVFRGQFACRQPRRIPILKGGTVTGLQRRLLNWPGPGRLRESLEHDGFRLPSLAIQLQAKRAGIADYRELAAYYDERAKEYLTNAELLVSSNRRAFREGAIYRSRLLDEYAKQYDPDELKRNLPLHPKVRSARAAGLREPWEERQGPIDTMEAFKAEEMPEYEYSEIAESDRHSREGHLRIMASLGERLGFAMTGRRLSFQSDDARAVVAMVQGRHSAAMILVAFRLRLMSEKSPVPAFDYNMDRLLPGFGLYGYQRSLNETIHGYVATLTAIRYLTQEIGKAASCA